MRIRGPKEVLPRILIESVRFQLLFHPVYWLFRHTIYQFVVQFATGILGLEVAKYPLARFSLLSNFNLVMVGSLASTIFVMATWHLIVHFAFEYFFCASAVVKLSQQHINPNDCLYYGLSLPSSQMPLKLMAFLELEMIAKVPSERRKTIFSEIDDIPTVWFKYSTLICRILDELSGKLERDVSYVEAYIQGKEDFH
jgi:hypothetical protein